MRNQHQPAGNAAGIALRLAYQRQGVGQRRRGPHRPHLPAAFDREIVAAATRLRGHRREAVVGAEAAKDDGFEPPARGLLPTIVIRMSFPSSIDVPRPPAAWGPSSLPAKNLRGMIEFSAASRLFRQLSKYRRPVRTAHQQKIFIANFAARPTMQQISRRCQHHPYPPCDVNDGGGAPAALTPPPSSLAQAVVHPPSQFRRHRMLGIPSALSVPQPS